MNAPEFVQWLKIKGLFSTVMENYKHFENIYTKCLDVKNQQVLILTDKGYYGKRVPAIMAGCYLLAAKRLKINVDVAVQEPKFTKDVAEPNVVDALANLPERSVIAIATSGKTGSFRKLGKSYRRFVRKNKHQFVSTGGLVHFKTSLFNHMVSAINIDYDKLRQKGRELKEMLDYGKEVSILTKSGTSLRINIQGMTAISNDGFYRDYGGNIPTGEVYIPPRKNKVEGTIVIDGSAKTQDDTLLIKEPIRLRVEKGEVTEIKGGVEAKALERTFEAAAKKAKYPWGIRRIGELGIGINPGASIVGPTIINEKSLGTAHIGIGSNHWFGGSIYAITHLDQVFREPKIFIDNERINV